MTRARLAAADVDPLVKNWWMMAGRGILAVAFGSAIALWRMPVFDVVIISFGTYAIADGILAIASAFRAARPRTAGWPIALEGIISVVLGVLAFARPFLPRGAIGVLVAWGLSGRFDQAVAAGALLTYAPACHARWSEPRGTPCVMNVAGLLP